MKKKISVFQILAVIVALSLSVGSCKKDEDKLSSDKKILSFKFEALLPQVEGIVDEANKTISLSLPSQVQKTSLVPSIVLSSKATISPASGVIKDFTNPISYTVTAEDGSTTVYLVTVTGGYNPDEPETLSGTMSSNTSLPDRNAGIDYIIDGVLFLDGNALLTIEAGVKIAFTGVDGRIDVGEDAGLKMTGTADKNIIITGPVNNPNKGAWGGINYYSNRSDNVMEFVQILNAGQDNGSAVSIGYNAKLAVRHCIIDGSLGYGLSVDGNLQEFTASQVNNCVKAPIYVSELSQLAGVDMNSSFTGNTANYFRINNTNVSTDIEIKNTKIPYFCLNGLDITSILTLPAGTEIMVDTNSDIWIGDGGKLLANGTAAAGIKFTGAIKESGSWIGLIFNSGLSSTLSYCTIEYAGSASDGANIDMYNGRVNLQNCLITNSLHYGVVIGNSTLLTQSGNSFSSCADGNVYDYDNSSITTNFP
jgi:hypothetical protein